MHCTPEGLYVKTQMSESEAPDFLPSNNSREWTHGSRVGCLVADKVAK